MSVALDMALIEIIQYLLRLLQLLIRSVALLHLKDVVPCITQMDCRNHPRPRFFIQLRRRFRSLCINKHQLTRSNVKAHRSRIRLFCLHRKRQRCLTGKIDAILRKLLKNTDNFVSQVVCI